MMGGITRPDQGGDGETGRREDGKTERRGDGETGRRGDGETERRRDGETELLCEVTAFDQAYVQFSGTLHWKCNANYRFFEDFFIS